MSENNKILFYLEELPDYEVAADYQDVRGWDVIDAENRTVGKVASLLVNKKEERVVYLDVEVDESLIEAGYNTYQVPASEGVHGFLNRDGDEHLIVPIGMVRLNKVQQKVMTNEINYKTFAMAKRINKGAVIDRDYEFVLFRHYIKDDTYDMTTLEKGFYNRKEFKNTLRVKDS